MYACIYIYAYVYVHVYVYSYVYVSMYICMFMCMYMYIYIYVYRCIHEYVYMYICRRGGSFLKEGVLSVVFSIFNAGGSVCGCVCAHTYTHYTDGVLGCEPRSRDETPGGPE